MIIATISGAFSNELVNEIIEHPMIGGVRWNTGVPSIHTPYEILARLKTITSKPIWVDLKCRQLRIAKWAIPYYGEIELNHKVEIELPAQIHFRGAGWIDIKAVNGNNIYLVNPPEQAIGQGQSVNIRSENLEIKGYFTEEDLSYIRAAEAFGMNHFMLSFFEGEEDIRELKNLLKNPRKVYIGLKIESKKGIKAAERLSRDLMDCKTFLSDENLTLVVARDDLLINLGDDVVQMLDVLKKSLEWDQNAIAASQFFSGLEHTGVVSAADISDLHLLHNLSLGGFPPFVLCYQNFMLSDEICLRHFHQVMSVWEKYYEMKGDPRC